MNQTTLVLLSGLDGTGRLFKPLLEILPPDLRPLVIPYPANKSLGHDELFQYVREQIPSDDPFILLAESFSGSLAVELAATRPPNLKALILCASFVTSPAPKSFGLLRFIINGQLFRLRPPRTLVRYLLLGKDAPPGLINELLNTLQSVSPEVLSNRVRSVLNVDVRGALEKCRVPILYLAAKHDKLVGKRNLAEIKSLAPDLDSVIIDAPHLL
ncbi:MAG TPA: alpha/beta hydrolase, partial [Pyrinomonadaceae bacterium]|nr:alpha/beta hydrolase [Pyrinomonadaceae bacterium]